MQAVVERVIRAFTLKNSPSDEKADGDCRTPAGLAADLLENYRAHLLHAARTASLQPLTASASGNSDRQID